MANPSPSLLSSKMRFPTQLVSQTARPKYTPRANLRRYGVRPVEDTAKIIKNRLNCHEKHRLLRILARF